MARGIGSACSYGPSRRISVSTYGETYWIVTFTTVVTVVVPDVPVTLTAAAPFGVPGEPPLELEEEDAEHPTIIKASVNTARHMPNTRRRLGACRNLIMPVTRNAHRITASTVTPNGHGPLRGSAGINVEAAIVESVSWTVVPFGGVPGVTGFDPNAQDAFAGRPEQLSVNVRFEPGAAYSVSGTTRLWPAVTTNCAGGGANPATVTVSFIALEVLMSEFGSPS
jgi:hypothetical protein